MFLRQRDGRLGMRACDFGFLAILIKPSHHGQGHAKTEQMLRFARAV
jgi:hypothetical protein